MVKSLVFGADNCLDFFFVHIKGTAADVVIIQQTLHLKRREQR
jgi:hypothetical protein